MSDPTPLEEKENTGEFKTPSGPEIVDPSTVQTLFNAEPKKCQWLRWIEQLLSDVPITEVITDIDHLMVLCDHASNTFTDEPNMLTINVEEDRDLVLVGDVHGQFKDLSTHILSHQLKAKEAGKRDKKFLFLGDYVDRGPQSAEVLTLLMCLKVEYPDHIYMLRGNHEEFQTCRIYGFSHECTSKFKDQRPFQKFNVVFTTLPLAAAVECKAGRMFCCHGGLSPRIDLVESIQFVARTLYEGGMFEEQIVDGLLWSDPGEKAWFHGNARGCGFLFGPEATKQFLTSNKFDFIVRAHQLQMNGWAWEHDNKVLTIFSAPNYCGINGNKGGILIINGSQESLAPDALTLVNYDSVEEVTPLFCPSSPIAPPKPSADAAGSYFKEGEEEAEKKDDAPASDEKKEEPSEDKAEETKEETNPEGSEEDREALL